MSAINGDRHFLFTKAGTFGRLLKSIYGDGHIKTTTSKNHLFLEAVILEQPLPKNSFPEAGTL
jgi:hypothetical protein